MFGPPQKSITNSSELELSQKSEAHLTNDIGLAMMRGLRESHFWGALLALSLSSTSCSKEPGTLPRAVVGRVSADVDGAELVTNLEQIQSLALRNKFRPRVIEYENALTGNFTYVFTEEYGKHYALKGIRAGASREKVIAGISKMGLSIEGRMQTPLSEPVQDPAPVSTDDGNSGPGKWLILGGLGAAAFLLGRRGAKAKKPPGKQVFGDGLGFVNENKGIELDERPEERFADVGGLEHVLADFRELTADIKRVQRGLAASGLPRGILVSGPPGGGKTLLARALAGETNCAFIHVKSPELAGELYVGTGPRAVRAAFEKARTARDADTARLRKMKGSTGLEEGLCIVFLDEFDSLGRTRSFDGPPSRSEQENSLNTLLAEMDGLDRGLNRNIIVIAATNSANSIDPALLRPGRFTKTIDIPLPWSKEERLDILNKVARPYVESQLYRFESADSLDYIARITAGKSGDHLRNIIHEAVALADRDDRSVIRHSDLFEAFQRQSFGREKISYLPFEQRMTVAAHEHGHGLAALAAGQSVFLVSMNPRGDTLGRVIPDPESFASALPTRDDILKRLLICLGGRAAELEMNGPGGCTTGASRDLENARSLIRAAVSSGLIGTLYSANLTNADDLELDAGYRELIDNIISDVLVAARQVVGAIGVDKLRELSARSLSTKKDLIGPEANNFYSEALGAEKLARIRAIADEMLKSARV